MWREIRGLLEYLVLPALAVVLPWKLSVYFFKICARCPFLYREIGECALAGAHVQQLIDESDRQWLIRFRYHQLCDAADVYLCWLGRRQTLLRQFAYRQEDKPVTIASLTVALQQSQILFFPHHGAGLALHCLIQQAGRQACYLMNDVDTPLWSRDFAYGMLCRWRLKYLKNQTNSQVMTPDDLLQIRKALTQAKIIMVMPDVPCNKDSQTVVVAKYFAGRWRQFYLHRRFFALAAERDLVALSLFIRNDYASGRREIIFTPSPSIEPQSTEQLAANFVAPLASQLAQQSEGWFMLNVADRLLR